MSKNYKTFVRYCVDLCICSIPNVANNLHKFTQGISFGRLSPWFPGLLLFIPPESLVLHLILSYGAGLHNTH